MAVSLSRRAGAHGHQHIKNSPSDGGTQGKNVAVLLKKIYITYCFPMAVLFCIMETAWAPYSHPALSPSASRARLNSRGAVSALCGWREFQLVI